MTDDFKICPYTGLRPFTEDESIYFKGRDEHIDQATKQLQKNKFIMLTGASGDGKSSLVYAGILPNAKAGFLKSQFSNWVIADFRPERNPLGNLSRSLANQLGIANENTVRTELGHGFSALVDMYKASKLYLDVNDADWHLLDDQQKAVKKRGAANLIIIADQFEEFFTNPENFQKGVPSQDANLVTNLLLETARISLDERLPIYVIITMRSDFIGQCASFRGLPEAIGFSQFFVPRLNRTQLQEVIEEPASLSGNTISKRLTERLIHDMIEGTDQLPILQHALNQIWKMADEGRSEMDLMHYAMVGGIHGEDLPGKDADTFKQWFNNQPPKIKACYNEPDLQNILNTHANKLYILTIDYLKEKGIENISENDVHQVIETAFKCLTKIDNSRAVRNRMTLGQITAILNQPHLDYKKVGKVLDIFREPGNTLLHPFLEEVPELSESTVLDITHESLIRNWENLDQWAKQEFVSFTTYLDFSQQLNRWVDSGKSSSFLLYIGPLTYFENWYNKAKPNATWISRYLGEDIEQQQKFAKAELILQDTQEFLKRSASKHTITRAVMKYGPRRIAAVIALIAMITLSSFAVKTYFDHRNPAMLANIAEQAVPLMNNPKVFFGNKGAFIVEQLRLKQVTLRQAIDRVKDPMQKIEAVNGVAVLLALQGQTGPVNEISEAIRFGDSLFQAFPLSYSNVKQLSSYLKNAAEWRTILGVANFYNPSNELLELQKRNGKRLAGHVINILEKEPSGFDDILNFTHAIETAINFNGFTPEELLQVTNILSPFDGNQTEWVKEHFKRDKLLVRGYQGYGFAFNGLYQEMAYLYAAVGKTEYALHCVDTLLKYNDGYYEKNYTGIIDNASNITSVFYRSGHSDLIDDFVAGYCERKKTTTIDFYQRLIARTKPVNLTRNSGIQSIFPESQNLNLQYGDRGEIAFFFEKFRQSILTSPNSDEKNFLLAISYKDEGIYSAYRAELVDQKDGKEKYYSLFEKSTEYYDKVSQSYLSQSIEMRAGTSTDQVVVSRSILYLYPDVITLFSPMAPRDFHFNFMSASFLEYLIDEKLFATLFKEPRELEYVERWLTDYHYLVRASSLNMRTKVTLDALAKLGNALAAIKESSNIDLNLLYLYLGREAYLKDDQALAVKFYQQVKTEKLSNIFKYKIFSGFVQNNSMRLIADAYTCFVHNGKMNEANHLLGFFKKTVNRSSMYAFAARELVNKMEPSFIQGLLDSARAEMLRVENANTLQPNRDRLACALVSVQPTANNIQEAKNLIKNRPLKFVALKFLTRGLAYRQNLFEGIQLIPDNISDDEKLDFLWNGMLGYADGQPMPAGWSRYEDNMIGPQNTGFIVYVDETN